MNGGHDLGGRQGLGPIAPEAEDREPVFHSEWERRVFALTLATGMLGKWNIDESRSARERQDPAVYLQNSYYENWLEGLEKLLVEKDLLAADELLYKKVSVAGAAPELRIPDAEAVLKILRSGGSSTIESEAAPLFNIGDRVKVRKQYSSGHSRAPSYAQGAVGTVIRRNGCHLYPDEVSQGRAIGEHLYTVLFANQSLWGKTEENAEVCIDLWQPYLSIVAKESG